MAPNPKFMTIAVEEASIGLSLNDGGPFGAVIVKNGEIVAKGHNMVLISNDPTAHAEVTAIRNASKILNSFKLTDCVLYTSCYPCPMCLGAALWSGLDTIYFAATPQDAANGGFDDANFYEFVRNPESCSNRCIKQVVVQDYLKPFDDWNKNEDRIPY